MEPREVDIEFPRGDTFTYGFELMDSSKTPIELKPSEGEIYFTVKKNENTSDVIFQKKLSTNDIEYAGNGMYYLVILPNDTNTLKYGAYGYDITIKSGDYVTTQVIGTITLTKEYTHKSNE